VIVGVTMTVALIFLSYVRVSPSGISYRSPEIWSNQATVVLTQDGAPELRSVLPAASGGAASLADTSRFAGLIDVYATLATSDAVMRALERRGLVDKKVIEKSGNPITADAIVSAVGGGTTPLMTITATALSGPSATRLTRAATSAFLDVVRSRQLAAKIPVKDRIQLRVVKGADEPKLVKPRSKALPILVLLGGLIATLAVAFTRDNLARRQRPAQLTTAPSRSEPVESDPSVAAGGQARSTLGPVPRPELATGREDAGSPTGVTRGRSTLGSVPSRDSATAAASDQAPQLRQAGTSGRPQT